MDIQALNAKIDEQSVHIINVREELKKVLIGQESMVDRILIGLLSNGHVLLEGVPGLAKTLTIRALASIIQASFQRIQFTPDLLPADILGTMIYNQKTGEFFTKKGPIFAHIILADEINRAPAKVQSALLEAMQEKQVTLGEETFPLPNPFFVLATQNPLEQEGTYPLPEAQIDRFMLKVHVEYPSKTEEKKILDLKEAQTTFESLSYQLDISRLPDLQKAVNDIYIDDKLKQYIIDIVQATRQPADYGLSELSPLIEVGASPRASISLLQASKANAFLNRRGYVIPDDIKLLSFDVIRHRLGLSYEAEAEEMTHDSLIDQIIKEIAVP